jgi:hypothetical protein
MCKGVKYFKKSWTDYSNNNEDKEYIISQKKPVIGLFF